VRLVSYRHGDRLSYGAVKDDSIVDLISRMGETFPDIVRFIAEDGLSVARPIVERERGDFPYAGVDLAPVIPNPGKIICVGLNYRDHIDEAETALGNLKTTPLPMIFARWPASLTGHRQPIVRPKVSDTLDYEAELFVIVGKSTGRHLDAANALSYVFGYACLNEACVREYQRHSNQITPGKNFDRTGGTGPWIVTADEIPDPMNLDIEMRLNGAVMQHANTKQMINSIADTMAYITRWTSLEPGDCLATGTMGGVGFARNPPVYLKPGDVAEVEISGIGTLVNPVVDEEP
jgi:2-keto-4-pentenoate hydratase/2-oxohepta-3-ene-1,7-dioic acid hydratase in catechol pathway